MPNAAFRIHIVDCYCTLCSCPVLGFFSHLHVSLDVDSAVITHEHIGSEVELFWHLNAACLPCDESSIKLLTSRMVYVWGRRHQYVNLSFLGIFNFTAPYLPWVLLAFSLMLGSSPVVDLMGMAAGTNGRGHSSELPSCTDVPEGGKGSMCDSFQAVVNSVKDCPSSHLGLLWGGSMGPRFPRCPH